jgi:hypothetical protein
MMDWSPYPEYLAMAMNWWIPVSVLICSASVYLARQSRRPGILILGWCLHAVSATFLVSLGLWVFTGPLAGAGGTWWMWWNK